MLIVDSAEENLRQLRSVFHLIFYLLWWCGKLGISVCCECSQFLDIGHKCIFPSEPITWKFTIPLFKILAKLTLSWLIFYNTMVCVLCNLLLNILYYNKYHSSLSLNNNHVYLVFFRYHCIASRFK